MNYDLDLLKAAKELTGSSDISVILDAAAKIKNFIWPSSTIPTNATEFAEKCVIRHPVKGATNIKLYDYQRQLLEDLDQYHHMMITSARQMGLTTMLVIYLLYRASHNPGENIHIASNSMPNSKEIFNRMCDILMSSDLLVPATQSTRSGVIRFNNGSQIMIGSLSEFTIKSKEDQLHNIPTTLLIDNSAFISYKTFTTYWEKNYPEMVNTRIILASTAHYNEGPFYDLWETKNDFKKILIPWQKHPARDEAWRYHMIGMIGEESFKSEYECQFRKRK